MDFFTQQDTARRNTSLLVLLFVVAVLLLIAITNVLVAITIWSIDGTLQTLEQTTTAELLARVNVDQMLLIGFLVSSVVCIAIIFKWFQLGSGGKSVAESLGGARIQPNTDNPDEKRVLNVVEEMALASGMPVPPVYLLHHELGINAFAAGKTPADAVIGVTKGCATSLTREQLQGVIAHEFSHILNGDMRLNLQLVAMLNGIVFIGGVGRMLLHTRGGHRRHSYGVSHGSSNRRSSGGAQLMMLGLALVVLGWLGSLFGSLIRASVSRQREFLADASAVQFTRNPQGIADALKVIGGYQYGTVLEQTEPEEVSHLFFGRALNSLTGLFSTHPPLIERISRIDPHWDGNYILPKPSETAAREQLEAEQAAQREAKRQKQQALAGAVIASSLGVPLPEEGTVAAAEDTLDAIPDRLYSASREPLGAMAIVLALLLDCEKEVKQKQFELLLQSPTQGLLAEIEKVTKDISRLDIVLRLPLLEICIPALKCMSSAQYRLFKRQMMLLIQADQSIEFFECCLYQLVRHYLDVEFMDEAPSKPKYARIEQVAESFHHVLSIMTCYAHEQIDDAEKAFNRGANTVGLYNLRMMPQETLQEEKMGVALRQLACCSPLLKAKVLKAFANAAHHDQTLNLLEREMLTTLAALMDSPIPITKLLLDE